MAKANELGAMKPGSTIQVTVTKAPRVVDHVQTIQRLMRQDPEFVKALKKASKERMQRLIVRSRGGRPWEQRETSSKIVRVEKGATWKMRLVPQLVADLKSVEKYLDVKAA